MFTTVQWEKGDEAPVKGLVGKFDIKGKEGRERLL